MTFENMGQPSSQELSFVNRQLTGGRRCVGLHYEYNLISQMALRQILWFWPPNEIPNHFERDRWAQNSIKMQLTTNRNTASDKSLAER
jgi:hypothetical protein